MTDETPPTTEAPEEQTQEQAQEEEERALELPLALSLPLDDDVIADLRAGQWVHLSGSMIVLGRQACQHLLALFEEGEDLPIDLAQATVYFATPGHAPIGTVIGSLAPSYTNDFDELAALLLDRGVRCLMGRGPLREPVLVRLKRQRGVYFVTVDAAGALLARTVHQSQAVALEDLGREAIRSIKVDQFPCIVAIDGFGRSALRPSSVLPSTDEEDSGGSD